MHLNPSHICKQTIEAIKPVADFIAQERKSFNHSHIEIKGLNDLVSYVDKNAEEQLIKNLSSIIPGSDFIAEESFFQKSLPEHLPTDGFFWIIDPLDGTTNYIHNLPVYAISVALYAQGALQVGVVWDVAQSDCFYAWKGGGAWLNDLPIRVSTNKHLSQSLLATGFPYYDFGRMDDYLQIIHSLMQKSHGLRRMGSAAIDLAYVACGRFDGFFEYNLKPWDVAAGILLVQEAGGFVSDFAGGSNYLLGNEIVAAGHCFAELVADIKSKWYR